MKIPIPSPVPSRHAYEIKGPARILVVSDIHVPFHDPGAIVSAIEYGKDQGGITHVVVNGDLLDAYHLSTFEKDPRERRFREELDHGVEVVRLFANEFDSARVVLKLGNHEARFDRYLQRHVPEIADLDDFSLVSILSSRLPRVDIVEEWRNITAGSLLINHGHEVGRGSGGVHPARWLLNRTGVASLCGHFHRTDTFTHRNALGIPITSFSIGCLCNLSPNYLPRNQWNHGAAFVEVFRDGTYLVENKTFR